LLHRIAKTGKGGLFRHRQGSLQGCQILPDHADSGRFFRRSLSYLRSFQPGVQKNHDIAASLVAAGLLANTGIDGGGADQDKEPGGYMYELNEYAELLLEHGLK
ncbi:MAG: hypothetical protein ACK4RN_14400, partial [Pseudorhodobacter sp.]